MTSPLKFATNKSLSSHVQDELEILFNGNLLPANQIAFPARNGTSTLTLRPKPGSSSPGDQVMLDWGTPPDGLDVTLTPGPGLFQPLHPTEGATWTLECGDIADGVFSLKPVFTHLSLTPFEILLWLQVSPHKIHFMSGRGDEWDPIPGPPAYVYGSSTQNTDLPVRVTTIDGIPCEGFPVTYTIPGFPTGSGRSDIKGFARYPTPILFPEYGEFKLLAETTDLRGNVISAIVQLLTT